MTQEIAAAQAAAETVQRPASVRKKHRKYRKNEVITAYLCLLPSFVLMMLFITVPLILSLCFSFFDINAVIEQSFMRLIIVRVILLEPI